jgi:HlyD family secretion protein
MDKRKIIIIIVIGLMVLAGLLWFYFSRNAGQSLTASGTIEATEVVVSSKTVGKVLEVKVEEGDKVKSGDLIAQIDPRDAKAALQSANARFILSKSDFERSKELSQDKMISSQQFESARANFETAAAALETAKIALENTTIQAPSSGVILVKAIEPGELATVGTPIVTLANLDELKLTVYLAEKDVGRVKLNEQVSVMVDSYPKEKFIGKLTYISDQAEFTPKIIQTKEERITQVFGIKISIANPEHKLKPGMPADAEFQWNSR